MAKAKQWEDVRLLSFDLQTVEFTYASVRKLLLFSFSLSHCPPTTGLHALHILQRPAPHRRFIQPPIRASLSLSTLRARHPPKPTHRSRALPPRPPTPRPTRRRPTSTRFCPPQHRTSTRSPNTRHPPRPRARDTESRWLVARDFQSGLWRRRGAACAGLSSAYGISRRYARRVTVCIPQCAEGEGEGEGEDGGCGWVPSDTRSCACCCGRCCCWPGTRIGRWR
jgi:hypothetical protein